MGKVLWTCCKQGHALNPTNCYWEYHTLYPYKKCKLCRSAQRKELYKRGKTKRDWLASNKKSARRQGMVEGSLPLGRVTCVGMPALTT